MPTVYICKVNDYNSSNIIMVTGSKTDAERACIRQIIQLAEEGHISTDHFLPLYKLIQTRDFDKINKFLESNTGDGYRCVYEERDVHFGLDEPNLDLLLTVDDNPNSDSNSN
jgi:hypothetical protein